MQVQVGSFEIFHASLKKCQLPDEFSALGLGAFEKVGVGTCACVTGLDIKLVDAMARGGSRFANLLAPLKTYWPPKKN